MTNRVDHIRSSINEMEGTIKSLQEDCEHEFSITEPHGDLEESKVQDVYLGLVSGFNRPGKNFYITCTKCSIKRRHTYTHTCPRCFEQLVQDKTMSLRDRYWKDFNSYYSSRVYRCPNMDFAVVNDEWDQ